MDTAQIGPTEGTVQIIPREYFTETGLFGRPGAPVFAKNGDPIILAGNPGRMSVLHQDTGELTHVAVCSERLNGGTIAVSAKDGSVFYVAEFLIPEEESGQRNAYDFELAKLSPTGEILWKTSIGAGATYGARPNAIAASGDGVLLFAVAIGEFPDFTTDAQTQAYVAKYGSDGEKEWSLPVPEYTGFETIGAVAVFDDGTSYLQNDKFWCGVGADGTLGSCVDHQPQFVTGAVNGDLALLAGKDLSAFDPNEEKFLWHRSVRASSGAAINGAPWGASVLEVRAHSAARHHFISGNTYNMYANQGGLEKLTVDFVARIEPDGSMAWYRQFALAPSLSMATAPKETNLPKSTDGYVAFEVEGLGTSASGDVVVLGRRDDGIVSFTVDADTGDLLPSPQRKSIAVEVPPELGAECSP